MKGVKVTLDMKVNKNQVANWRTVGWYDKEEDCIHGTAATNVWVTIVDSLCGNLGKTGDYVTISFDAKGIFRVGGWNLGKDNFIKCSADGDTSRIADCGTVCYELTDKYRLVWVTYKLLQDKGPRFFIAVGIPNRGGSCQIRNIKVELSDHPTDYEE